MASLAPVESRGVGTQPVKDHGKVEEFNQGFADRAVRRREDVCAMGSSCFRSMPLFITEGRFTPEALRGMLAKPEDRETAIRDLFARSEGKLISYYMTFGDFDFLIVSEGPYEGVTTSTLVAAATGGVTDLKTTLAITSADMQKAFTKAGSVAAQFRPAGTRG